MADKASHRQLAGTWLSEFHGLFPEATRETYRRSEDLEALEVALGTAWGVRAVSKRHLETIEGSGAWAYQRSWPRLSAQVGEDVIRFSPGDPARRTIETLYRWLKHIEVVSVLLRFMNPKDYGIMSPPVASLLCLAPNRNQVSYYMAYLAVLNEIRKHYDSRLRIADVDVALWSAAQLATDSSSSSKYKRLRKEMYQDEFFQTLRLKNLLAGLPDSRGRQSSIRRLRWLAGALLERDSIVAGLLLARSFEELVRETAKGKGVYQYGERSEIKLIAYVDDLQKLLPEGRSWWRACLNWRNDAVHPPDAADRELTESDLRSFLDALQRLEAVTSRVRPISGEYRANDELTEEDFLGGGPVN